MDPSITEEVNIDINPIRPPDRAIEIRFEGPLVFVVFRVEFCIAYDFTMQMGSEVIKYEQD